MDKRFDSSQSCSVTCFPSTSSIWLCCNPDLVLLVASDWAIKPETRTLFYSIHINEAPMQLYTKKRGYEVLQLLHVLLSKFEELTSATRTYPKYMWSTCLREKIMSLKKVHKVSYQDFSYSLAFQQKLVHGGSRQPSRLMITSSRNIWQEQKPVCMQSPPSFIENFSIYKSTQHSRLNLQLPWR